MIFWLAYLLGGFVRLIDVWLARSWSAAYFTGTIPIFRYTAKTVASQRASIDLQEIERHFQGKLWPSNSIRLKAVSRSVIWFHDERSMWLASRFRGLMHGRLVFEPENGRVVATGFADLASVYAWIAMVVLTALDPSLRMALGDAAFVVLYGAVFAYQGFHMAEFVRYVAESLNQQCPEAPARA